jgi:FdhD protein
MQPTETLSVRRFSIRRIAGHHAERALDTVAAEEPLEIRIQYWIKEAAVSESLAITMRTPGHDRELAAGLLVSEGIVQEPTQLIDLHPLGSEPSNEIVAELSRDVDVEVWKLARHAFVNSSCGLCGKRSREAIAQQVPPVAPDDFRLNSRVIESLPDLLRERQSGFMQTGALHAAALVDAAGRIQTIFEDIGRHNALDKLIGWCLLNHRLPLREQLLFLSSRSSFELIQKAAMAGAPALATVGGPSSLAIEAAREFGITLIGFLRENRFNVYSGEWRIDL